MNKVIKKIIYRIQLKFVSPINISSGFEGNTDSDVMVDFDGNPFIPGSSIAGAFRTYAEANNKSNMQALFGYENTNNNDSGKMSAIFISDLEFDKTPKIIIRDSVALTDEKTTIDGAKFDFEALEGETTKGHFFLEVTIRENSKENEFKEMIDSIFCGIDSHEIRLGSNKTRGYGIVEIENIKLQEFDAKTYLQKDGLNYTNVYSKHSEDLWKNINSYDNYEDSKKQNNYIHIEVPLKLRGGISIRKYAVEKNSPDFEQITDHGKPVIPGTSFNGAIRHRVKEILKSLSKEANEINVDNMLDNMFGYVNQQEAQISNVIFDETVIDDSKPLIITRTGISRFESAAKNGALYQEKTYVQGNLMLKISVKKGKDNGDWMIGLLLLAIRDLQNGYLAVGGQTSVGRGLFESNGLIKIDNQEKTDKELDDEYISKTLVKYKEVIENAQ